MERFLNIKGKVVYDKETDWWYIQTDTEEYNAADLLTDIDCHFELPTDDGDEIEINIKVITKS